MCDTKDFQVKLKSDKIEQAQFTTKRRANSFFLTPVTFAEVKWVLGSIRLKKFCSRPNIPSSLIQTFPNPVIDILVHLINLTFTTEIFSTLLKNAKVSPIFKKGYKLNLTNYRPISVLNSISKILEKLLHKRTMLYFNY